MMLQLFFKKIVVILIYIYSQFFQALSQVSFRQLTSTIKVNEIISKVPCVIVSPCLINRVGNSLFNYVYGMHMAKVLQTELKNDIE